MSKNEGENLKNTATNLIIVAKKKSCRNALLARYQHKQLQGFHTAGKKNST